MNQLNEKNYLRYLLAPLLLVIYCFLGCITNHASTFTISVQPVIPQNQQGDSLSAYNLSMQPNEHQTYQLEISNTGDRAKTVDISINDAGTLPAGQIDLTSDKPRLIKSMKYKLSDLITLPTKQLTVAQNDKKYIEFSLTTPEEALPGILLGSIYVLDKNTDINETSAKGGTLHNQLGYPVEIMLASSEKQVPADLTLSHVKATTFGGHPSLEVPIENSQAHIIPDLKVTTVITNQKNGEKLINDIKVDNQLAPQSIFPHQVKLSSEKIKAGTYLASISAVSAYGKWAWEKEFTITAKEAKTINEETVQKQTDFWPYYLIGLVALLTALVSVLLLKIRQLKRCKKEHRTK